MYQCTGYSCYLMSERTSLSLCCYHTSLTALCSTIQVYLSSHNDSISFLPSAAIEAPEDVMKSYMQLLSNIQEDTPVQLEDLEKVCTLSHVVTTTKGSVKSERHIQEILASYIQQILTSPVISLLDVEAVWKERAPVEAEGDGWKYPDRDFPAMVKHFRATQDPQVHIHPRNYYCMYIL